MASPTSPHLRHAVIDGRYTIRRKLGSGSLGAVYLAHDAERERLVALKVIRSEEILSSSLRPMQDEFRAIARLAHPHIAKAYDFGFTEAGIPYYTREYVRGSPLPAGPPRGDPPARFLRPLLDLLDALAYLHSQKILHLDIHAGNLIVAEDEARGSVVIDIGFAGSPRRSAFPVGGDSWPALPPELLEGKPGDVRSDLFLVGRLLHYRLTGQTRGKPGLPHEISGWGVRATLELERVLTKALQSAPERRFRSAEEFQSALGAIVGAGASPTGSQEPQEIIVGRELEIRTVERALDGAASGAPVCVWFTGKTGLGKTRLLSEARLRAQLRGLPTLETRFLPDAGPEPLLIECLRRSRVFRGSKAAWLEPLEPHCGGTPRERAQRAAEAYFHRDEKPAVLLLDDVDLADRRSRELSEAFVAEIRRRQEAGIAGRGLALLVTSSAAPPAKLVPRAEGGQAHLRLKRLNKLESEELFWALTRPLTAPPALIAEAIRRARGVPLLLRQLAMLLRRQWKGRAVVPETAEVPDLPTTLPHAGPPELSTFSRGERMLLMVLGVIERAADRSELAETVTALGGVEDEIGRSLRRLVRLEILVARGRGSARHYQLARLAWAPSFLEGVSRRETRVVHEALVAHLRHVLPMASGREEIRCLENLARHLLVVGRPDARRRALSAAVDALRGTEAHDRAVRLLESGMRVDRSHRHRLRMAGDIGSIAQETGDYEKGIAVFEPFYREAHHALSSVERVRVRRHLGYHYHRAGFPDRALEVFQEARSLAVSGRDDETLVFIDSELAELHIFRGAYEEAEATCRRGLDRIGGRSGGEQVLGRMQLLLRASLGHIHMRRLDLSSARRELHEALDLSRTHGLLVDRAAILHNLAITESQLNEFPEARRRFAEAEALMLRAGNHRDVIKVATNLALIEAKLGRRSEADFQVEKAAGMLRQFSGQRLECFVAYSRGVVAQHFGVVDVAVEAFERSAELAGELGDTSMRQFSLVNLAETRMASGRYAKASQLLEELLKDLESGGVPILERMVWCRIYLLEMLLGRRRRATAAHERFRKLPRTEVLYLETWNDLVVALGHLLAGEHLPELVENAIETFDRLKVPVGSGFGRLLRLTVHLKRGDTQAVRQRLESLESCGDSPNLFLRAAEPLAAAEARFCIRNAELSERFLTRASSAIVGSPFLELDGRIELLRSRLALGRGDLREARRHLHRCLHARDLLRQFVPEPARRRFVAQPRFETLKRLTEHLSTSPTLEVSTKRLRRSCYYEGMVGQSRSMTELFQTLERIRGQEFTVLIVGETGSGKELVARAIHGGSLRHQQPLQTVSCACLSPELFESELFGHAAGAFTGAEGEQSGILEVAAGGTVLLDEVSLLPLASQAKLLRVLETGVIRPLGSTDDRRLDVRFLATTSTDLQEAVAAGGFREDLLYRLSGIRVQVPSLRERKEDIPSLVKHLLEKHAARLDRPVPTVDADGVAFLQARSWPGNVRELEMLLLRALVQASGPARLGAPELEDLVEDPWAATTREDLTRRDLADLRRDLEREYLKQLFFELDGDTGEMMRRLGVKSTKLYAWLRDLGLDVRSLRRKLRRS